MSFTPAQLSDTPKHRQADDFAYSFQFIEDAAALDLTNFDDVFVKLYNSDTTIFSQSVGAGTATISSSSGTNNDIISGEVTGTVMDIGVRQYYIDVYVMLDGKKTTYVSSKFNVIGSGEAGTANEWEITITNSTDSATGERATNVMALAVEAKDDAQKHAQNTTSFTDSEGNTFDKGAKGWASDAEDAAAGVNLPSITSGDADKLLIVNDAESAYELTPTALSASVSELNYAKGVTSAIQTQLDGKQPLDSELTTLAGMSSAQATGLVGASGTANFNAIDIGGVDFVDSSRNVSGVEGTFTDGINPIISQKTSVIEDPSAIYPSNFTITDGGGDTDWGTYFIAKFPFVATLLGSQGNGLQLVASRGQGDTDARNRIYYRLRNANDNTQWQSLRKFAVSDQIESFEALQISTTTVIDSSSNFFGETFQSDAGVSLPVIDDTSVSNPPAGYKTLFFDSSNADALTSKDSSGTLVTY